jgi:NTE family protein
MAGRALVFGGGGVTGVAWEFGVLAGLAEAGVDLSGADLSGADLVVGTSAGSVVGAQVAAGVDIEERYAGQLAGPGGEVAATFGARAMLGFALAAIGTRDPQRARVRLGRMALGARTIPEAERRAVIASRLAVHEWPERRLLVTAVVADTGEFVVFDKASGVPLVDAVTASCAVPGVWPPATIDGRRYIDGGARSAANVDLAAGCDRVVVIAPAPRGFGPIASVARQVAGLRKGTRVAVVVPDAAARKAIGRNVLDPARRAGAARAGRAQAAAQAEAVAAVWSG